MEKQSISDVPVIVTPQKTAWLNVVRYTVAQLDQSNIQDGALCRNSQNAPSVWSVPDITSHAPDINA